MRSATALRLWFVVRASGDVLVGAVFTTTGRLGSYGFIVGVCATGSVVI
jgi:hypothetical protein